MFVRSKMRAFRSFAKRHPEKRFETPAGTCLVKINSYLYGCFRILSVMKKEWNDVREFHEKFGHPCPDAPRMLDKNARSAGRNG